MNLLTICLLLGAFLAVKGQDPTTVCYAAVFQADYFNLITGDKGSIYVDFGKQKFVEVSLVTRSRYIHDFANLKSYAITGSGNNTECQSYKLDQSQVMYRCLPPYAKPVPEGNGFLHYVTNVKMAVQTWEVYTESDLVFRVIFSVASSYPFYAIFSQEYDYHGTRNLYLYTNHYPAVTNQTVFNIPASCNSLKVNIPPIVG